MRFVSVLACLTACAASADPERSTSAKPKASTMPVVERPRAPISGAHGAAIAILAVAPDGDAAISADSRGGIRLWPALDGRREPLVLRAGRPSELAIARTRDGFLIANVDVSRGLELLSVDMEARVRHRVMTRGEAVDDVVIVDGIVLALRADQTIEALDAEGRVVATLVPDPGTRVRRLVAAGSRVLAIGERGDRGKERFVRWIDPRGQWGATTRAVFGIDPAKPIAVSPDGEHLVANSHGRPSLIEIATGKAGPAICGTSRSMRSVALGFVDADTVACIVDAGKLVWWSTARATTTGTESPTPAVDEAIDRLAHGIVVSPSGHDLVLRRTTGTRQLGYATSTNTVFRLAPGGITIAGVKRSLVVDATLRERARAEHPTDEGLLAIGDGYAIAISTPAVSVNDAWGASHALSVLDLARGVTHQKLGLRTSDALVFEPTTGLLATIDGADTQLLRYDPTTHTFGSPITLASEGIVHRIALLDPTQASGVVAMTLEERATSTVVGEIHGRDLQGAKRVRPRRYYAVPGHLYAVDRAGRVYTTGAHDRVRVTVGNTVARDLPITDVLAVVPDPTGARLAVLTRGGLSLHLADGTLVWTVSARELRHLRWLGDDLVASYPDALARFDLATGELAARQCGWDFGLHDVRTTGGFSDSQNVCDAD